ncbi:MAG: hypothetical protein A3B68_06920 [Candidatus Melainabacteria bacterium RIFCSPHIGHO2_02_FULL_34_12]|nr:MAG: hypothetical protein A3B68_06920 [Candidatus Melainabacteria bacterium RIFCSPHIGHO2_02_FULL_34_12]
MNLCFDFDGPIIDVTDRYYRAYLESLKGSDTNLLPKEVFWGLKQRRVSDLEIGLLSGLTINQAKESSENRKDLSFKNEYFALDKLFDDVLKTFESLKSEGITFFIVTLRRRKQLQYAIKQFKLEKYLSSEYLFPLPDDHRVTNDIQEKYIELVNAVNKLGLDANDTWIIGDSETDIHAGRLAKYGKIIGITRGIRSKEQLEVLQPDYLINNLSEILSLSNL